MDPGSAENVSCVKQRLQPLIQDRLLECMLDAHAEPFEGSFTV